MQRVAITGLGIVSSIGWGVADFWESLASGKCGIESIERFDTANMDVGIAGEIKRIPSDYYFRYDPKVGFAMAAAEQALTNSGVDGFDSDTLLSIGSSLEIFNLQFLETVGEFSKKELVAMCASGKMRFPLDTAGRMLIGKYGRPHSFKNNVSACAAGLQTVGLAFRSIQSGECRKSLAGGFDSMVNPLGLGGFNLLGALSKTGCKPFDAGRSGLVLGEGAAMLFLEDMELAQEGGKKIFGEIVGYASTLDAINPSAPDQEGVGAENSMRGAIADAGISPSEISYINAHGTGTFLNDPIEATAIRRVFADNWDSIPVTATKSQTGHLIAAAGALELVASIFSFEHNMIPANIGLDAVARGCELNHVFGKPQGWQGDYILSNSFGFGGQNSSMVLKRYNGE